MRKFWLLVVMVALSSVQASEQLESSSLRTALVKALQKKAEVGGGEVLVAFDLDDTLMRMRQHLGGEEWWEWQATLLSSQDSPFRVGCSLPSLLEWEDRIVALSAMHPTEPDGPAVIRELAASGIHAIVLTSRGYSQLSATLRELTRNGYDFATTAVSPKQGYPSTFLPLDPANPELSGLTREEVLEYRLEHPRPVAYLNGVFLTAGQHKGAMLKALQAKTGKRFKAIVFVDNLARHTEGVYRAFIGSDVDITVLRYSGSDDLFAGMETGRARARATADFLRLRGALEDVFGALRPCRLPLDTPILSASR